eukprot:355086-Chlamydomonas_euryale.AAC.2
MAHLSTVEARWHGWGERLRVRGMEGGMAAMCCFKFCWCQTVRRNAGRPCRAMCEVVLNGKDVSSRLQRGREILHGDPAVCRARPHACAPLHACNLNIAQV